MFACAIPLFFYKITEKKQREMVAEIEARKENK
jgi:Na+/melibiose symporter-like transporter